MGDLQSFVTPGGWLFFHFVIVTKENGVSINPRWVDVWDFGWAWACFRCCRKWSDLLCKSSKDVKVVEMRHILSKCMKVNRCWLPIGSLLLTVIFRKPLATFVFAKSSPAQSSSSTSQSKEQVESGKLQLLIALSVTEPYHTKPSYTVALVGHATWLQWLPGEIFLANPIAFWWEMMMTATILIRRTNEIPTGGSWGINFHFVHFPTLFILSSFGQDRYSNNCW